MLGGIYTIETCFICGKRLRYNPGKRGCVCEDHPQVRAKSLFVRFPGDIFHRHTDIDEAEQDLNNLRVTKRRKGERFNPEDYRTSKPNAFAVLAPQYLAEKKALASYKKMARYINLASLHFGVKNIQDITSLEINQYVKSIPGIGENTRSKHRDQLHNFWAWCLENEIITMAEMPHIKKVAFKMGWRKVTTWERQEEVIAKVKEISYAINPKIWLGIDMLATYAELRPFDLLKIREGDYDRGFVTIFDPSKSERIEDRGWLTIRLHDDHVQAWEEIRAMFPTLNEEMPFFRHHKGMGGVRPGAAFGDKFLLKYWNKACKEIGLEGVGLYGGTRHTTVTETTKLLGPKASKKASGHRTNKAFDRYSQAVTDGAFEVVDKIRKAKKKGDVIKFERKDKT